MLKSPALRLTQACVANGHPLPDAASVSVHAGDLRTYMSEGASWKERAFTAGFTTPANEPEYFIRIRAQRTDKGWFICAARHAPKGFTDLTPWKVFEIVDGQETQRGAYSTRQEAHDCCLAFAVRLAKEI